MAAATTRGVKNIKLRKLALFKVHHIDRGLRLIHYDQSIIIIVKLYAPLLNDDDDDGGD